MTLLVDPDPIHKKKKKTKQKTNKQTNKQNIKHKNKKKHTALKPKLEKETHQTGVIELFVYFKHFP